MDSTLTMMLLVSASLGIAAVSAFAWALKSGQFDDIEKDSHSILFDGQDDLQAAIKKEQKQKELKEHKN